MKDSDGHAGAVEAVQQRPSTELADASSYQLIDHLKCANKQNRVVKSSLVTQQLLVVLNDSAQATGDGDDVPMADAKSVAGSPPDAGSFTRDNSIPPATSNTTNDPDSHLHQLNQSSLQSSGCALDALASVASNAATMDQGTEKWDSEAVKQQSPDSALPGAQSKSIQSIERRKCVNKHTNHSGALPQAFTFCNNDCRASNESIKPADHISIEHRLAALEELVRSRIGDSYGNGDGQNLQKHQNVSSAINSGDGDVSEGTLHFDVANFLPSRLMPETPSTAQPNTAAGTGPVLQPWETSPNDAYFNGNFQKVSEARRRGIKAASPVS